MDRKLLAQAIAKFSCGGALIATLLFVSAGTLHYWNAWLMMGLLFIPMFIVGIILLRKNPDLLRKRLSANETEPEQKSVVLLSTVLFAGGFIMAGLDFRFRWLELPKWLIIASCAVFLFAYVLYAEVLRENEYLSRTVAVQEHQRVIDTGLYGIVRHPMYTATVLLFLSMPLVLGSLFSFLIFLPYPFLLVRRIRNEEQVLEQGLLGYAEYKQRVKYRMLPFIY